MSFDIQGYSRGTLQTTHSKRGDIFVALAMGMVVGCVVATSLSPILLLHHDLGCHIATGYLIRSEGRLPPSDPWTFASNGQPWILLAWFWEVLASYVFEVGGFTLLLLAHVAAGGLLVGLLSATARFYGASLGTSVLAGAGGLVGEIIANFPPDCGFSVAPQAISQLFAAVFLSTLIITPSVLHGLGLVVVFVLWINMHGAFPVAFSVLGAVGLEALFARRWRSLALFSALGLAMVATIGLNPLGWGVLARSAQSLPAAATVLISEWAPLDLSINSYVPLYCIVFFVLLACSVRHQPIAPLLLSLAWLALSFRARRHIVFFFLFSAPVMAIAATHVWRSSVVKFSAINHLAGRLPVFGSRSVLSLIGIALAAVSGGLWFSAYPNGARLNDRILPIEETEYLLQHHHGENVLNHWNFGSYMLFRARGELRPFVDGRAGTAYPKEVFDYLSDGGFQWQKIEELVGRYNIRAAIMPSYCTNCMAYFEGDPRWSVEFRGPAGVVYKHLP